MRFIFLITSLVFSLTVFSQVVNCSTCNGTGKETKQSPYECQNCKSWNSEYRRKVACNVCRDTRVNPNRKTWTETCSRCNGTGRNYAQEARNKEFGGKDWRTINGAYSGRVANMEFKSLSLEWREAYKGGLLGDGIQTEFAFNEWATICGCFGSEWSLPNKSELESITSYLKLNGLLNVNGNGDYATSSEITQGEGSFKRREVWTQYIGNTYVSQPSKETVYTYGAGTPKAKIICVKSQSNSSSQSQTNPTTIKSQTASNTVNGNGARDQRFETNCEDNVNWDGIYPLYSALDDLEIKPNTNGEYLIWTATDEDPTPRELKMVKGQIVKVYKFKTYEECLRFCKGAQIWCG
jgi:hypothetical protein